MTEKAFSTFLELSEIQGLVVSGYADRPVAGYALFQVTDVAAARKWLGGLVERLQFADFLSTGRTQEPLLRETALNVAFSHAGLEQLSLPPETLGGFSDSFKDGMAAEHKSRQLGDDGKSNPSEWDWGGPADPPVHGVLCGFTGTGEGTEADERDLEELLKAELDEARGVKLTVALPARRSRKKELRKEHFGFRDGISNPAIAGLPGEANSVSPIAAGELLLGYPNAYDKLPFTPRVPEDHDPGGILPPFEEDASFRDFGKNGSYLVFRQLEQDVATFWQYAKKTAAALSPPRSAVWLATRMVGRWPDGSPLTLHPEADSPAEVDDTRVFKFSGHDDAFGQRCPVGSHIRRTNPRDTMMPLPHDPPVSSFPKGMETMDDRVANVNRHRIIRRGRPYGEPLDPELDPEQMMEDDGKSRGLYFLCFNTNLRRQFDFVQSTWIVNPAFAGLSRDPDPLLAADRKVPYRASNMTLQGGPKCPARRIENVPRFVEVRGGAYFFMPGRAALRYLAGG